MFAELTSVEKHDMLT